MSDSIRSIMNKCNQCGKATLNGMSLCVDCYSKFMGAMSQQYNMLVQFENSWLDNAETLVGVRGLYPRQQPIQPLVVNQGNTTINNLNLDRTTIGLLNTGTVENISSTISIISVENPEIAQTIKGFVEEVSKASLSQEEKRQILEQLSFISTEIKKPKEKRNSSVVKALMSVIGQTISTTSSLLNIWNKVSPYLTGLF